MSKIKYLFAAFLALCVMLFQVLPVSAGIVSLAPDDVDYTLDPEDIIVTYPEYMVYSRTSYDAAYIIYNLVYNGEEYVETTYTEGAYVLGAKVSSVSQMHYKGEIVFYNLADYITSPGVIHVDYAIETGDYINHDYPYQFYVYDSGFNIVHEQKVQQGTGSFEYTYDGSFDIGRVSVVFNSGNMNGQFSLQVDTFEFTGDGSAGQYDEILHGYDNSTLSGATDKFVDNADNLASVEDGLSTDSKQYVNDFTSTGFDSGVLQTLGSSLTFLATWFTNFWNMGGVWTSGLTFCFALTIAFIILKVRK